MANTGIEKRKANTRRRTHLYQRKSGLLLLFYFYFLLFSLHLSFMTSKALKTKEKDKDKEKSESGSGHSWTDTDSGPGSGPLRSGFWFRVRLRIRFYGSTVRLASKARISFTDFAFYWTDFLRHGSSPSIECASYRLLMGGTVWRKSV